MKRWQTWAGVIGLVAMVVMVAGCQTGNDPAAGIPSDIKSAAFVANADSRDVTLKASELDRKLLATALESIQESGAVAYVERTVALRSPDKTPVLGADGNPVLMRQIAVCKVNSLKELTGIAGADKVTLVLAGGQTIDWDVPVSTTDEILAALLEGMRLEVTGLGATTVATKLPEIIAARAAERDRILQGLAAMLGAKSAGYATVIKAIGDGLTEVVTATGEQISGVLVSATPIGAAAEAVRVVLRDPETNATQAVTATPAANAAATQ